MTNTTIASHLLSHAGELESHGHNLYRVRAYRKAAALVKMLPVELEQLLDVGGRPALQALPGIGSHLAVTLESLVREDRLRTMGPKPEETDPEERLTSLPGVGPVTALRLTEELGVETASAVVPERLSLVGVGPKRRRNIEAVLRERRHREAPACEPSVEELLGVDEEYRALVAVRGEGLGTPILRTSRGGWNFRVTFSPSPLAYRLGRQRDWIAIHFDNGEHSGERIIVTESRAPNAGQRVVRGRERECQVSWAS